MSRRAVGRRDASDRPGACYVARPGRGTNSDGYPRGITVSFIPLLCPQGAKKSEIPNNSLKTPFMCRALTST